MKVLVGILCALMLVTAAVAGYAAYEQHQNAQQLASVKRSLSAARDDIDELDDRVGDDLGGFGSASGFGNDDLTSEISDLTDRVDQICMTIASVSC